MPNPLDYTYDPEVDAAYVKLSGSSVEITEEVIDGVLIDRDAARRPVGIEILGMRHRIGDDDMASYLRGLVTGLIEIRRDAAE